jgi:hypothetical protein
VGVSRPTLDKTTCPLWELLSVFSPKTTVLAAGW